jgi:hypothetical protein
VHAATPAAACNTLVRGTACKAESSSETLQVAAGVTGCLAAPLCLYSEFVLKTTGSGLPPGPGGVVGAAEGISYLVRPTTCKWHYFLTQCQLCWQLAGDIAWTALHKFCSFSVGAGRMLESQLCALDNYISRTVLLHIYIANAAFCRWCWAWLVGQHTPRCKQEAACLLGLQGCLALQRVSHILRS